MALSVNSCVGFSEVLDPLKLTLYYKQRDSTVGFSEVLGPLKLSAHVSLPSCVHKIAKTVLLPLPPPSTDAAPSTPSSHGKMFNTTTFSSTTTSPSTTSTAGIS